jgi:hypothetical protein
VCDQQQACDVQGKRVQAVASTGGALGTCTQRRFHPPRLAAQVCCQAKLACLSLARR